MNQCWDEGALRAYYDRELPPEELTEIAAHLGACAACHGRYNELASRAGRVSSLLAGLESARPVTELRPSRAWKPAIAAAALALAAAAALAFILIPKREAPVRPVAAPHIERVHRPIQAETPAAPSAPVEKPAPARRRLERAHAAAPTRAAATEDFLALDDDPIDVGVVMRVALDRSATVQADVIFDDQGRPRAIREVQPVRNSK